MFTSRTKDQGLQRSKSAVKAGLRARLAGRRGVGDSPTVDDFDSLPVGAEHFTSMEKVHEFMAQSGEALILTDGEGKITAINKQWVDMCGYTAHEIGGKTCAFLQGQETDMEAIAIFNQQIQICSWTTKNLPAETTVVNYKKGEEGTLVVV